VSSPNIAVYYTTAGYKDIQNGANTLRKFVNIRTVRPLPVIEPVAAEICAGESVTLSTSTSGTIYDWRVLQVSGAGSPTNPVEVFSSSAQSGNVVTLNLPGTYQIKLRVFENCCGWSIPVYRTVLVKRRPPAPQFVQSTARVCQPTSDVVYEIQPVVGADTYEWTVSPPSLGSITSGQGTTQIAVTWFGSGTGTVVARAIGTGCLSGIAVLNVEVVPPPSVSLSVQPTAICEGNEVTFTASGTGEIYRFTAQGGAVLQDWSGLSTYVTNQLVFGQNLVVQAQAAVRADNDALCLSPLSNPVSVNVSPIPSLTLTASDPDFSICEGDFVTITANPQNVAGGIPRYLFYRNDNPNDVLGQALQTQNFVVTDQLRDGDVVYAVVFNGPPTDCPSQPARLDTFRVQRPPVTGVSSIVPACGPPQTAVTLSVQNTEGSLIWQIATNLNYPNYQDIPGATHTSFIYNIPQITGSDTTILYFRARYTVTGGCVNIPLASNEELFYVSRAPRADSATVCENGQATFFVPAPCPTCLTQWYDSPSASIPIFTGNTFTTPLLTAPVTYYVAFRYPGGCVSARTPFKVKLFDTVFPNAQNQERCGPGNVTLSVTPDPINCPSCAYNWYDNAGNYLQSGATFNTGNISQTTTYRVEAVSLQGCVGPRQSVSAIVRPLPEVQAVALQPAICIGASTALQASGAATYSWIPATGLSNPNISNPVANPAATTTYTVTGIANDGCQNTASVTVTVHPLPNVSAFAVDNTLCLGENTPTFTAGAVIYNWAPTDGVSNPSAPTPILSPTVSTTYTVTGTDANGCSQTTTLSIEVLNLPEATATAEDGEICAGSSTRLNAGGGVSYLWAPSAGLSDATIPDPVASPNVTRTYTVTVTDAGGCRNTASVTVVVVAPPVLSASADDNVLCIGERTNLTVAGGPSDANYVWQPAESIEGPNVGTSVSANPASTTTYTVSAVFGDDCVAQATVAVVVNPLPNVQIAAPTDVVCLGQSVNLFATGAVAYVWNPATGLNNPNIPNPFATPAQTTAYTVTGTDANGCVNTRVITLTVNPLPQINATTDPPAICTGQQTAQLQATGATSYLWSPAAGLSNPTVANPVANPGTTTTYTVTGTDDNGCTASRTLTVVVHPLPNLVAVAIDPEICLGNTTILSSAGATNFVWEPASAILGPNNLSDVTANPTVTTVFTVTGSDDNGCVQSRTVTVAVNPQPTVSAFAADDEICVGQSVRLSATGAINYTWEPAALLDNPNVFNPVAAPPVTTTFT
ncbi:MAG: hypothetical protein NZ534_04365, partial [Bacteroidia bacterium]|nr:hypothetical protein [Bacteroidia bacterium]